MREGFSLGVNPLFLLVILLFALAGLLQEALIAFILVVIHEFFHLLAAYFCGYRVNKIELFPFGGVAEYRGLMEMEPWTEIKVALAGPASNLFLAMILWIVTTYYQHDILTLALRYNIIIGFFNLIPALPLDGGRVLRGFLVLYKGFKNGTYLAINLSKILALIGGILGFIALILQQSNIWILFISFFVYGAALKEEEQHIYTLFKYLTKRQNLLNDIRTKKVGSLVVKGDEEIKDVIYMINPVKFNLFYILDSELKIAGTITEIQLLKTFFKMKDREVKMIDIIQQL